MTTLRPGLRLRIKASTVLAAILSCQWVYAASVEEIALMNRAERQKILVEGAKKEA